MGERDEESVRRRGVDRGSAEPTGAAREEEEIAAARDFDPELLEEAGGVPPVDALDVGERGAPAKSLDTGAGGTGTGPPYEGRAGTGAKVREHRDRAQDVSEGEEPAAARGPAAGLPETGGGQGSRDESSE